jgi:hypothetical protein
MAVSSTNRVSTAALAESIATELARAAHHLSEQGQAATAEALLQQARHNRILALRLRAEAGVGQCLRMVGQAGSDSPFVS